MASPPNTEAAFEDCARVLTPALMAYFIRRVDPVDYAADCVSETLLVLIVWDGFGVAEAGALLGLSATAVRTRYSRARKHLRAIISS
jgi:DNA-directed RNA polymerase specialized sigma24 family protein